MESGSIADWVLCAVTLVSAAVIVMQLREQRRSLEAQKDQMFNDHERSRRVLATEMMFVWTKNQKIDTSSLLRLFENLSEEVCMSVIKIEPIQIDDNARNRSLISAALKPYFEDFDVLNIIEDKKIKLDSAFVSQIRFALSTHLNTLECILSSWNAATASQKIIEDQFSFLIKESWTSLPKYRAADIRDSGNIDPYPSISNFIASQPVMREPPMQEIASRPTRKISS